MIAILFGTEVSEKQKKSYYLQFMRQVLTFLLFSFHCREQITCRKFCFLSKFSISLLINEHHSQVYFISDINDLFCIYDYLSRKGERKSPLCFFEYLQLIGVRNYWRYRDDGNDDDDDGDHKLK